MRVGACIGSESPTQRVARRDSHCSKMKAALRSPIPRVARTLKNALRQRRRPTTTPSAPTRTARASGSAVSGMRTPGVFGPASSPIRG
jgi:hypothetical protein